MDYTDSHNFILYKIQEDDYEFNTNLTYYFCKNCDMIVYISKIFDESIVCISNQNTKIIFNKLSLKQLKNIDLSCDDFIIKNILE